jgi:hypothetical protein
VTSASTNAAATAATDAERLAQGLFFIVGTGRCGTTLLQAMLSRHPRLHVPPETNFFAYWDPERFGPDGRATLGAGETFRDAAHVREHLLWAARMRFWGDLELDHDRLAADTLALGGSARALFLAMMLQFRAHADKPRLGEKTPIHHKHVSRITRMFPDARIIFMYRDPRDTATSMLELDWGRHGSAFRHARTWKRAMRLHHGRQRALESDRYAALRYETLVESPDTELARLCAFLGEPFDPAMLSPHEREDPGFNEREMKWKGMTLQPVTKKRIGRFREKLTPLQIWLIERITAHELAAAGYRRDQPRLGAVRWNAILFGEWLRWQRSKWAQSVRRRLGLESKDPSRSRLAVGEAPAAPARPGPTTDSEG